MMRRKWVAEYLNGYGTKTRERFWTERGALRFKRFAAGWGAFVSVYRDESPVGTTGP